jgi:protoporphyrin/coproporphyrin ferrochelatase
MNKTGVLLINLGTPDAPTPEAVGRYLREFLMDGFVIDLPAPLRWLLVNVAIVPRRKYQSAAAYQKVQMTGGSPLLVHTRTLAERVALELADSYTVEYAMRYGNPSIASALTKLCREKVARIIVLPLYPQYAQSSFETAVVETKRRAAELGGANLLTCLPPFYDQPEFIKAWVGRIHAEVDAEKIDHLLFSFHSVPVRHLTKFHRDSSKPPARCCTEISSANENCYRAQCFETARSIAAQLELHADDYTVSFQSRLGRAEWIGPNTVNILEELPQRGVKRVAVVCPSFVADCLETVEEIGLRGRETFLKAGGEELQLVTSLNADPVWAKTVADWIRQA